MSTLKIHSKQIYGSGPTNSRFVLALFGITILFQLTVFKYIWAIEGLSRIFNSVALLIVCFYSAHSIIYHRFSNNVWHFYILPGLLVFTGMFINFTRNSIINPNVINYFGQLFPWATYLAMPALLKKNAFDSESLWRYFYYFMLTVVLLGLSEYFLVFYGKYSMHIISTAGGDFLAGKFSILYFLKEGGAYNRFYACFPEPGTLPMFLIPVMAYAYFNKKYIGLSVFILALLLSYSLGGMIAFAMLIPMLVFVSINKRKVSLFISISVFILTTSVIAINYMDYFTAFYERKGVSASTRVDNIANTTINLPAIIVNNPIGFELAEGSPSASTSKYYYGSNFAPGHILQMGGIIAFLGYSAVLLVSLVTAFLMIIRKNLSLEEKMVFTSLIVLFPFIFQRQTLWDSVIFSLLFAPSIIRFLKSWRSSLNKYPV